MASSFNYMIEKANNISQIFREAGYNSVNITSEVNCYQFNPKEWIGQDMISYQDHGSSGWAGISSAKMPDLSNAFVFSDACSTCSTYNKNSFCNTAIRKGALAHLGAVCVAWTGNNIYRLTMNGVYYESKTLGKAFKEAYYNYGDSAYRWMTTVFGDPTLEINPSYLLKEPLVK